eukprot:Partr_v1_DN27882_c1_g1_i3_m22419 putative Involved in autophagy and cytoplasm to vacuole transport (Cvt) vesicle formation. Plays a key role in the organization of the preautophagosomal structure phagophore assembly site (PAS), the nucleating site for formation of the sequestering vesicle. Cycles between the PAS and the cytoplasmic vesicle pool and may participate in supplying membrane for the growing autophagosome
MSGVSSASSSQLETSSILTFASSLGWFHKISLLIFACFWLGQVLRTVKEYRSLVEMHEFYLHILRLTDDDLNSIQWEAILAKVQEVHASVFANDPNAPQSSTLSIVNRIMRQDNYLIALFNKNILDLRAPVPHWIPLIGNHQLLSQVMQWNLKICMMDYVFGEIDQGGEISVKPVFLRDGNRLQHIAELRKRFIYMGILNLLLAPFTLVFLSVYFLFKYGEELHKNPTQLGARSYSPLARWKFRDFNELPHLLQFRLYSSYDKAMEYMGQFTSEKLAIVAKFISYVAGSIALSLTVLSLLDDEILLHFQITQGRSTLWYLGLFSVIWSASRAFVPDPHHIQRPEELLREVIGYTHFFPREWKQHGLSSIKVTRDFGQYFDYRILLFVHELMSVAVAPFILIFQLPDCSPQILDFFRQFTVHVDGVGNVCTYAMFEFRMFNQSRGLGGNINDVERNASVPAGDDGQYDDKLKTSMMNFKQSYRNWEPRNPNDSRLLNRMMASNQSPRTNSEQPHNILHSPTATESSKYYIDQILEQERRIGTRDSPPTVNAAPKQSITTTYVPPPHLPIADSDDSEDDGHELELDPLGAARM